MRPTRSPGALTTGPTTHQGSAPQHPCRRTLSGRPDGPVPPRGSSASRTSGRGPVSVATPPVALAGHEIPRPPSRPYDEPWVAVIFGGLGALSAAWVAVLGLTTVCAALAGTTAALSA